MLFGVLLPLMMALPAFAVIFSMALGAEGRLKVYESWVTLRWIGRIAVLFVLIMVLLWPLEKGFVPSRGRETAMIFVSVVSLIVGSIAAIRMRSRYEKALDERTGRPGRYSGLSPVQVQSALAIAAYAIAGGIAGYSLSVKSTTGMAVAGIAMIAAGMFYRQVVERGFRAVAIPVSETDPLHAILGENALLLPSGVHNAWAKTNGRVLVTTALVDRLTVEEVGAIVAHERGHLARRDAVKLQLISLAAYLALVAVVGSLVVLMRPAMPLLVLVWGVAAGLPVVPLTVGVFSRRAEFAADRAAAAAAGPEPLISGLEKIHAAHGLPDRWLPWDAPFLTHPDLATRRTALLARG